MKKSILLSIVLIFGSIFAHSKNLTIPQGTCVDFISVNEEDEPQCDFNWVANEGCSYVNCPIEYSIRNPNAENYELLKTYGSASDCRQTSWIGVFTVGLSEVAFNMGYKQVILTSEAKNKYKAKLQFLKGKACKD